MNAITVYNPSDSVVQIDEDRSVAGHTWASVDQDKPVKDAISAGRLVKLDATEPEPDMVRQAYNAIAATKETNEARAAEKEAAQKESATQNESEPQDAEKSKSRSGQSRKKTNPEE